MYTTQNPAQYGYNTREILAKIASLNGLSGREIGEAAGIILDELTASGWNWIESNVVSDPNGDKHYLGNQPMFAHEVIEAWRVAYDMQTRGWL